MLTVEPKTLIQFLDSEVGKANSGRKLPGFHAREGEEMGAVFYRDAYEYT